MKDVEVKKFRNLIDVTKFQTVINYVNNPSSEISQFINVGEEDLAEIAYLCIFGGLTKFKELWRAKKISVKPTNPFNAVEVIYLPPYYLFNDLQKLYE